MSTARYDDPPRPHSHEPNPDPPSADPTFVLFLPTWTPIQVTVAELRTLPETTVSNCYIVSTGHGTSGPYTFTGVTVLDLLRAYLPAAARWSQVEVISADGFGTRLQAEELWQPDPAGPPLLSYTLDGRPMTRTQGLVRLIVPSERDDALRQVKWVGRVSVS
ncbi:MAG: molybdopterin-dependent oxidoreductase [Chloroflexota bacterium]